MGTTLTGKVISATYDALLKVTDNDAITSSAKQITDGLGNNTPLYISSTRVGIGVSPTTTFHVSGNSQIGGNLTVTGDLLVEGSTTTIDTSTLSVEDPLIIVGSNNTTSDAVDLGIYGVYDTSGSQNLYAGIFRRAADNKFHIFRDLQTEPTTTVNTSGTGYTVATLVGNVEGTLTGVIASTTTATTQSQGDNSTKVATTAYVDSAIGGQDTLAEILANGNTTGGTDISVSSGDDITFADNSKSIYGAGSDLQISHNGTDSIIYNGTGALMTRANDIRFQKSDASETIAQFLADGPVKLYYDNAQKFQTTSSGIEVTGDADVSGNVFVGGANSNFSENNLRFKSTGAAYIDHNTVGQSFIFRTSASSSLDTTAITIASDADVTFGGDILLGDNKQAIFGAGSDLKIFSDGSGGYIRGLTAIQSLDGTDDFLSTAANAGVSLFYNNSKKFETTSAGVEATGTIIASGRVTGASVSAAGGFINGSAGGIRVHSSGTKFFNITEANAARDNIMDIGASDARFKDLFLGGSISSGAITTSGLLTSTLAINQATLPDAPSEHVITLNPPTTTNYYGGGISWSEGSNTAASLGVYDAGSGGALGFYIATGNNTTLTKALTIDNTQNSIFAGKIFIPQSAGNLQGTGYPGTTYLGSTTNATTTYIQAGSTAKTEIELSGGDVNSNILFKTPNSSNTTVTALTLDTNQNATFAGNIQANGTFIELDSPSDAQFIIDRASTSDVARVTWRNAGTTFFTGGLETSSSDMWSLLHTCGSGLYFDGTAMAFGFGVDNPSTAITLPQGNSTGAKISWYDGSNTFAASIYAKSSNDKLTFATKNSSNAETTALEIDISQNSTFYGNLIVNNSSNAPYIDFVESGAITDSKARITMDQVDTNNGELIFSTEGSGTLTTAVTIDSNQNTTFAGPVWIPTYIYHVGDTNSYFGFPSDDTFAVYTDGVQRFIVTSEGQVYNRESPNRANTAYGYDSGNAAITTANGNTTYGYNTGHAITSGCCNTLIGRDVGANITTGAQNVGVGQSALNSVTTALELVAVGYNSMITATTSSQCTAVGTNTLKFNTGNYNDAFGFRAGETNTTGAENSFIGRYSGFSNTTGSANTALGNAALESNTTGGNNTALGYLALYDNTTAGNNTAVGGQALRRNTTGTRMTAVGLEAGAYNTTGNYSTYVGYYAGQQATTAAQVVAVGDYAFNNNNAGLGTAVGQGAGQLNTTGEGGVYIGCGAGQYNQTGHYNVAVGFLALGNNSAFSKTGIVAIGQKASYFHTADYDVYVGYQAGYSAGTGGANVGVGFRVLHDNSSGDSNVGIGYEALRQNTTGVGNTCVGRDAGRAITTGTRNTMLGAYVGAQQTTSGDNTLIGYVAGDAITSGGANTLIGSYSGSAITTGNHNVMLGYATGDVQTTASYNTLLGNIAGTSITTGGNNTAVGHEACRFLTTGSTNTVVGLSVLENGTTAYENTAVGYRALRNCSTGAGNIALGLGAGLNITTGGSNIAIGYSAMGSAAVTGGGNLALGDAAGYALTSGANNVLIGKNAGRNTSGTDSLAHVTTQSNQIHIGNKTHTDAKVNISWTVVSDKRDKTKIKELDKGLDFVENLKPVSYERRKNRETQETDNKERYGFLAQDVLELEGDSPVIVNNEDKDNLKLTSDYIIPILVNAIKELKQEIEILKSK